MVKIEAQTGTIKIWFGLLKLALAQGLPINDEFYAAWGSREELAGLRFNQWWRERGKALFMEATPKIELVDTTDDWVTVRIPRALTAVEVKQQVSQLVTQIRASKRVARRTALSFVGDVKYRTLKQYERLLEIELDRRNAGKTIEQKTEMLRGVYRRIKSRLDKQRATLQHSKKKDRKGRLISTRFKARDPDGFGSAAEIRKGIDAKKVSRWRLSGKILLLNVAQGSFPGKGYYGRQLSQQLRVRLEQLGLEDIGSTQGNVGGGRAREDLTRIRIRKPKKEAEAESLRAYGSVKNPNRWGTVQGS